MELKTAARQTAVRLVPRVVEVGRRQQRRELLDSAAAAESFDVL